MTTTAAHNAQIRHRAPAQRSARTSVAPLVFVNQTQETFTPTHSGAIATVIWETSRAARADGYEPLVLTRDCEHAPYDLTGVISIDAPAQPAAGVRRKVHRLRQRIAGWPDMRAGEHFRLIERVIRRHGLDDATLALHNDPHLAVHLRRAFPRSRIVHLFHNHFGCAERYRRHFEASVDRVLAVSEFTAGDIQARYGLMRRPDVVFNGVDTDRFCPASIEPEGPPVIGFIGRTGPEKAPDLFLDAALKVSETTCDFAVQLVGANHWGRIELDDYQRQLLARVERLRDRGIKVRTPGFVDRWALPEVVRRAHIHVTPSRWDEPCALVTLEAMATGLATVGSNVGGTSEVIGDAGITFTRDSVDELADILLTLLRDPAQRRRLGRSARERALNLSWTRTWARWRDLLDL